MQLTSFQAIRNKGRADDEKPPHALAGERSDPLAGERREPGVPPDTGLEGDGVLLRGYAGLVREGRGRPDDLGAVAGRVRR